MELTSNRNEDGKERHLELVLDGSQVIVKSSCMLLVYADIRSRVGCCSGELSHTLQGLGIVTLGIDSLFWKEFVCRMEEMVRL